eukprot:1191429-Prorocentrum_minimum.AAC.1
MSGRGGTGAPAPLRLRFSIGLIGLIVRIYPRFLRGGGVVRDNVHKNVVDDITVVVEAKAGESGAAAESGGEGAPPQAPHAGLSQYQGLEGGAGGERLGQPRHTLRGNIKNMFYRSSSEACIYEPKECSLVHLLLNTTTNDDGEIRPIGRRIRRYILTTDQSDRAHLVSEGVVPDIQGDERPPRPPLQSGGEGAHSRRAALHPPQRQLRQLAELPQALRQLARPRVPEPVAAEVQRRQLAPERPRQPAHARHLGGRRQPPDPAAPRDQTAHAPPHRGGPGRRPIGIVRPRGGVQPERVGLVQCRRARWTATASRGARRPNAVWTTNPIHHPTQHPCQPTSTFMLPI